MIDEINYSCVDFGGQVFTHILYSYKNAPSQPFDQLIQLYENGQGKRKNCIYKRVRAGDILIYI
jgi:hypothetical protein